MVITRREDDIYLESVPGPDAGHSEDVAGELGGGALGERGEEDDDHGDHPVVEELPHREAVRHLANNVERFSEMRQITSHLHILLLTISRVVTSGVFHPG